MIKQMIQVDPAARPTFDTLLHISRATVFPESFFSFLHNYVASVNELPSNSPFTAALPHSTLHTSGTGPGTSVRANPSTESIPSENRLPSDSDHRMERIWADYEGVEPYLVPDGPEEAPVNLKSNDERLPTGAYKPFQVKSD